MPYTSDLDSWFFIQFQYNPKSNDDWTRGDEDDARRGREWEEEEEEEEVVSWVFRFPSMAFNALIASKFSGSHSIAAR